MKKLVFCGVAAVALCVLATPILAILMVAGGGAGAQAACANHTTTDGGHGHEKSRVPINGPWQTTSEWGQRTHPIRGDVSHHYGLDFVGDDEVVAASGGAVDDTPTTGGEGNEIVLDHGGGVKTKYKHLASRDVSTGDTVESGEQIGVMGQTGQWATGVHLHFEVWQDGNDTNPRRWLSLGKKNQGTGAEGRKNQEKDTEGSSTMKTRSATSGTDDDNSGAARQLRSAPSADVLRTVDRSKKSVAAAPEPSHMPEELAGYSKEQVANAATMMKVGKKMDLDAHTVTLAVMTAIGESDLINVDHGDDAGPDSRGVFQQRASWGPEKERMNVASAARMFFDELTSVEGYKDLEPTIAAHRTQHNADPGHYEPFWTEAKKVVSAIGDDPDLEAELGDGNQLAGCEDIPDDPNDQADPDVSTEESGDDIVAAATDQIGAAYVWGGGNTTGPTEGIDNGRSADGTGTVGFDCAGLVMYAVHEPTGQTLPRTAGPQVQDDRGTDIDRDWSVMKPGDVIGFSQSDSANNIDHDGIYIGDGKMVHAPRPGKTVEITQIKDNNYWESQTWQITRFTG